MSESSPPADHRDVGSLRGFDDYEMRLGDILRGERATLGKSLLDVQRDLRIRAPYIAAIENTDPSVFETPGFIAGYVRSYARYLGLDPDETYARFCEEAGFANVHGLDPGASSPRPAKVRGSRRQTRPGEDPLANPDALFVPHRAPFWARIEPGALGSVAVLVLLAAGLGYGGWSLLREVQQVRLAPVEQSPSALAMLDPLPHPAGGADALPDLVPGRPSAEALERLYRPQALDLPVLVARDAPIASLQPGATGALADLPPAPVAMALSAPPAIGIIPGAAPLAAIAPPTEPGSVQVRAPGSAELELFAVRPAWVRVRASDGSILLEKILEPGERFEIPATETPPTLRAGNSGAVYFSINGITHGPAGLDGQVTKNVPLSAEALGARFAEADPARDPDLATAVAMAEAGARVDGAEARAAPAQ